MLQMLVALQAFAVETKQRFRSEDGAAVVEYGIVLAFVVIVLATILLGLQDEIETWFDNIASRIGKIAPTTP